MRIDKAGFPGFAICLDANFFQMRQQLFLLVELVNNLLGTRQKLSEIDFWTLRLQSILGELLCVTYKSRRFCQHTRWHTAIVGAGSPQVSPLYQRYTRPQ